MTTYSLRSGVTKIKTKMDRLKTGTIVGVATLGAAVAMPLATHAATPAPSYSYTPSTYVGAADACGTGVPAGNASGVSATSTGGALTLTKSNLTADCSSAGATINGVAGLSTTGMTLTYNYTGDCGAGSPRFNVYLQGSPTIFLGCTYGDPTGSGTATFTAGQTYGGVLFPEGAVVSGIELIQDETASTTFTNISVNGTPVTYANAPTSKEQCKKGGYQTLTDSNGRAFKNQGDCVSFFATGGKNGANG